MATAIECPKCGKSLRITDSQLRKGGKCPKCQATFEVPRMATRPVVPAQHLAASRLQPADLHWSGSIAVPQVSVWRKLGAAAALLVLLAMPIFYGGVLVGLFAVMTWLATTSLGRSLPPAAFWVAQIAAGFALVCLIKRLVEPQRRGVSSYPVKMADEPLLQELLRRTSEQLAAPCPGHVLVNCDTRVALSRRGNGTLTLGLPLLACLSVTDLAGVLAYQLAMARQHSAAGITELIRAINGWLWRSVYGKSRLDQWLSVVAQRQRFGISKLLLPLAVMKWVPQAVLFIPMFVANTVAAGVIRLAERDADRIAARTIGLPAYAALLEREELIDFTWEGVLAELEFLHREQQLPDKLPDHLALRMQDMTAELRAVLGETINKPEERPFDSRASRPERLHELVGEHPAGAFRCSHPAKLLLASYSRLAAQMSRDYYVGQFGAQLLSSAINQSK